MTFPLTIQDMPYVVMCSRLEHPAKMEEKLTLHDIASYTAKRHQIGRASCRERVKISLVDVSIQINSTDRTQFFPSRRRHTRFKCDWSTDVCSSDLPAKMEEKLTLHDIASYTAKRHQLMCWQASFSANWAWWCLQGF